MPVVADELGGLHVSGVGAVIDFKKVREMEWDRLDVGGQPHAHICPICAAYVGIANQPYLGMSYREQHIRWHEGSR